MKKTMKAALAAAMMLLSVAGVSAQQQGAPREGRMPKATPEQMAQRQTERMTRDLSLTDQQAKQVQQINLEAARERSAKMQAHRSEMKAIGEKQQTQLNAVLTADQQQKMQQLKAQRCAKRQECNEGQGKGRPAMREGKQPGAKR